MPAATAGDADLAALYERAALLSSVYGTGPFQRDDEMFQVSPEETIELAQRRVWHPVLNLHTNPARKRIASPASAAQIWRSSKQRNLSPKPKRCLPDPACPAPAKNPRCRPLFCPRRIFRPCPFSACRSPLRPFVLPFSLCFRFCSSLSSALACFSLSSGLLLGSRLQAQSFGPRLGASSCVLFAASHLQPIASDRP